MRKLLFVICTTMCMFGSPLVATAGSFNAQGQFIGTVSPSVTSLLAQFPGGGPALRAAVALLLESDPTLADDVVVASQSATPGQKQAIGLGIADAARFFALCASCGAAQGAIRQAMLHADALTRTAFHEAIASDVASNITSTPPIFIPGMSGAKCVSPAVSPSTPNGC